MATIVYGHEGDSTIITRIDLGHGDEYLVEQLVGCGYFTVYSTFDLAKAIEKVKQINPKF